MEKFCTSCGKPINPNSNFCVGCGAKINHENIVNLQPETNTQSIPSQPVQTDTQTQSTQQAQVTAPQPPPSGLWYQDNYKIRKKVLTVWNKYWIEDINGNMLGFTKQKMFKLKEDIRIFNDESMANELFRIKQEQILDVWGNFAVIDSNTNTKLGYVKRNLMSAVGRDTWEILDTNQRVIGRIFEQSLGRALARKYLPGGKLVPEEMTVELDGKPIAKINQEFKIIGDIWNMNCLAVPPDFDRRVLLSCMILMGNIERSRK